jgi:predicted phage tail protein
LPIVLLEAGLVAAGRATLVLAFLTGSAFLAGAAFLATAFLAGAFFATAFFAGAAFLAGAFFTAGLALFLIGTRGTLCPMGAKCHSRHRDSFKVRQFLVAGLCLE